MPVALRPTFDLPRRVIETALRPLAAFGTLSISSPMRAPAAKITSSASAFTVSTSENRSLSAVAPSTIFRGRANFF
jgi:hypothetical protein